MENIELVIQKEIKLWLNLNILYCSIWKLYSRNDKKDY